MAKVEFDFWHGFLEARKEEIAGLEKRRQEMEDDVESKEDKAEERMLTLAQVPALMLTAATAKAKEKE